VAVLNVLSSTTRESPLGITVSISHPCFRNGQNGKHPIGNNSKQRIAVSWHHSLAALTSGCLTHSLQLPAVWDVSADPCGQHTTVSVQPTAWKPILARLAYTISGRKTEEQAGFFDSLAFTRSGPIALAHAKDAKRNLSQTRNESDAKSRDTARNMPLTLQGPGLGRFKADGFTFRLITRPRGRADLQVRAGPPGPASGWGWSGASAKLAGRLFPRLQSKPASVVIQATALTACGRNLRSAENRRIGLVSY
jgi:hypothetical protein